MDREATSSQIGTPLHERRQRLLQIVLWGVVGLLLIHFARFSAAAAVRPSDGFLAYYTASRLTYEDGANLSRFYDNTWFRQQTIRFNANADDIFNVNPPTASLLLMPFAGIDYKTARVLWTALTLGCLGAGAGILIRELELYGAWVPAIVAGVFVYHPIYANLHFGQAYVLLFALLLVAWYGYRHRRSRLLGVALGLMLVLKTAGVLLWLLVLLTQRWRALIWGAVTTLLVGLGTLPALGVDVWSEYLHLLPGISRQPWVAVTAQQTQLSLLRHLFTFDAQWNPAPLWPAPMLSVALMLITGGVVLGISAVYALQHTNPDAAFGLFSVATVVLAPVALEYHYVLMLLPAVIAVALLRERATWWLWGVLIVALMLIALDLPYRSVRLTSGAMALLAYPKLYGAWLLWFVILIAGRGTLGVRTSSEYA